MRLFFGLFIALSLSSPSFANNLSSSEERGPLIKESGTVLSHGDEGPHGGSKLSHGDGMSNGTMPYSSGSHGDGMSNGTMPYSSGSHGDGWSWSR